MKKIVSLITALLLITALTTTVLGIDPSNIKGNTAGNGISDITGAGQKIIGIIQVVGSIAAVAVLVVLGIKYMMGSTEEKAEYKKTMMPYLIGAVLIFAAANLAGLIYKFAQGL